MSDFQRYAIFYLPDDVQLAQFGAGWLGWDSVAGQAVPQPLVRGIDLQKATRRPRKYGFHGTLKAPFHLAPDTTAFDLLAAVERLAATQPPAQIAGLAVAHLGNFLALVPDGDATDLAALAARCVTRLDAHRAPLGAATLARRRLAPLTARQDGFLTRWGYPYVLEDFRFHMTLSGPLDPAELSVLEAAVKAHLPPLPRPFDIRSISVVGERRDRMFQLVQRFDLSG